MTTPIIAAHDGVRLTVNTMVKSPTLIPKRILSMMENQFLADSVLRSGGSAPGGAIMYWESTPLYADTDPQVLDEFGEIPTTSGKLGTPKFVRTVRRALGFRVSKTMQDRNNVDAVNTQITQIRNTMIRSWEDAFFSALVANTHTMVLTTDVAWGASTGTHIRRDVNGAKYLVKNASASADGKQKFGFEANTLIISTETEQDFLDSDEVNSVFVGNVASEGIKYKGVLPKKFQSLDVVVSWRLSAYAPNAALVVERNTVGGISDERPLQATPLYGEGNGPNGGPTESFRSDITRASGIFVDQPKAACWIVGVNGGSGTFSGVSYSAGTALTYPDDARV